LEKHIRDLRIQLEDLNDDLTSEREQHQKMKQKFGDLAREYETLKTECVDAVDRSTLALGIQQKKDEELRHLQVWILANFWRIP
jgi:chromosome segregation ATPase